MKQLLLFTILALSATSLTAQSIVRLTPKGEPGRPFILDVNVLDINTRKPVPNAEVYVYQTNHTGDYERDANDVPRIHGTAVSDKDGKVRFSTIYPRGYNNSDTGEHMHFTTSAPSYQKKNQDLIFADYYRKRYDNNNPEISKVYLKTLEEKDGTLFGEAVIYLRKSGA